MSALFKPSLIEPVLRPGEATRPWHILIVDDEPMVHTMTRLALGDMRFDGRGQTFHSAHSLAEAQEILERVPDIAVAFIDVVMETDHAGLDLVSYIRNELANASMRIVLRTGQPGHAPERVALNDYDINAYLDKTGTDATRLYSTLLTALRSHNEVTRMRTAMQHLETLAATDQLTGLSNVKNLRSALTRAIGGARRRDEPLSIVFLDVDDFKRVNDEAGHLRGDEVLRAVGSAILSHSRIEDGCFRYGGDEFLVILPMCTAEQARAHYCRRLQEEFVRIGISASQGVAQTGPLEYDDVDGLLSRADQDMYAQKRARKGLVREAVADEA
jgi:diguanylate cyclase (GGDEF)-like protein